MTTLAELLAHPDVAHLARALDERPGMQLQPADSVRLAAIALVLRPGDAGDPELLMIKRAESERDPWSGHIACPGGRMESTDRDLEATAVRETWEETGIDLARDGRALGTLDDISPRSPVLPPIMVRPFVFAVRPETEMVHSVEVAEAFWVPIAELREQTSWGSGTVAIRTLGERQVSIFRHGEHVVWGLTERVLKQFMEYLGA